MLCVVCCVLCVVLCCVAWSGVCGVVVAWEGEREGAGRSVSLDCVVETLVVAATQDEAYEEVAEPWWPSCSGRAVVAEL